LYSNR